jgi:hypothetical protein
LPDIVPNAYINQVNFQSFCCGVEKGTIFQGKIEVYDDVTSKKNSSFFSLFKSCFQDFYSESLLNCLKSSTAQYLAKDHDYHGPIEKFFESPQ